MEAVSSRRSSVTPGGGAARGAQGAFDLKGTLTTTTVMRLRSRDLGAIERQLRTRVSQFPQFFQNAPMVVDFTDMEGRPEGLLFDALAHLLRARGVVPVGVTNLHESFHAKATAAGFGILQPSRASALKLPAEGEPDAATAAAEPAAPAPPAAVASPVPPPEVAKPVFPHKAPLIVRQPVRSGQQVYVRQTDLIVLAPVNPGARVIADGHVHVYAPLRGSAIAGASGDPEARIFCQKLHAEMLGIAGAYLLADDLPADQVGRSVQAFLENGECQVVPM